MRWKAVTPNFTVSEDWRISIEKLQDEKFYLVKVSIGDKVKERLFGSEDEADDFIAYLTNNML